MQSTVLTRTNPKTDYEDRSRREKEKERPNRKKEGNARREEERPATTDEPAVP